MDNPMTTETLEERGGGVSSWKLVIKDYNTGN